MKRVATDHLEEDDEDDALLVRALERYEQMGGNPMGPLFAFHLQPIGRRRRWRNVVERLQFHADLQQLRPPTAADNIGLALTEALHEAIDRELQAHPRPPHDFINFAITAHGFTHAYQSINFTVGEFLERSARLDELLATLAGKLNSNEAFDPQRGFQVDVVLVSTPTPGRGKRNCNVGRRCLDADNKKKKCIIPIKNTDDLCCARAIVTMRAHCHRHDRHHMARSNWNACRDNMPRQTTMAHQLHEAAGVPKGACGLEELQQFQAYLSPTYQLLVMCRSKPFFLIFKGPPAPQQIRLLKSDDHYDGCTSFPAFVNRAYWCQHCERGFNVDDVKNHPCQGRTCKACNRRDCPDYSFRGTPTRHCPQCNGRFYGDDCYSAHVPQICKRYKTCMKCQATFETKKGKRHCCGVGKCPSCREKVILATHRCFIQSISDKELGAEEEEDEEDDSPPQEPLFVYADIEAMQMPDRVFQVNLLCYRHAEEDTIHSLWGSDACLQFLQALDALTEQENGDERPLIIMFHNLKGFDGMFLIEELYKQQRPVERQLTVGAKVLSFESGPLTFKDSLCFLPMPLSAFTSTFNLQELKKGYFPHLFNTPDRQDYVGPIPALSYYDPDGMDDKKKAALETWHAEQVRREVVFDFKKELEAYCQSDVALLQGGCEAFCQEFQSNADFNPMEKCMTIASACNLYWRNWHLPDNTIAVQPVQGWRGAQVNQSLKALQWLYYCEHCIARPDGYACADRIKHVRNGGEQTVVTSTDSHFVDGYDPTTCTVYEFHGCLWHGCPRCYPTMRSSKHVTHPDRTLDELYRATQLKTQFLRLEGYTVVEQWECDWDRRVQTQPEIATFVQTLNLVPPLEPRDAFFGGRTGAVCLHATANSEEEAILYQDVTSLYPFVNKTGEYPVGHPQIITQPRDQCLHHYFGVALVDILPPAQLYHPVLPVRHGGKLTFPLCAQCVEEEQSRPMLERSAICLHDLSQRCLRGTWCTPELEKALEVGYTLVKIHEVWHFPQRKTGLFEAYVNTWLKIKQESAGWPRWCVDDNTKNQFLQAYKAHEGIELDPTRIAKNPGRKATAKLMLNSFWGKFGERQNKPCTQAVKHPVELYQYLYDPALQLSTLRICTDDLLEVVYTRVEDDVSPSNKTNIFIAAFTTCYARLKLYSYLQTLQQQVLYYDTDSVIYKWSPGQPRLPNGDYLGELTDELEGDVIEEFVSGGAKNYGYRTRGGKVECKVRGFTLNVRGSNVLNFDTMKSNILKELDQPLDEKRTLPVVNPHHFDRDVTTKRLRLVERVKNYSLVFDKRVLVPSTRCSLPYGYTSLDPDQHNDIDILANL